MKETHNFSLHHFNVTSKDQIISHPMVFINHIYDNNEKKNVNIIINLNPTI